MVVPNVERPVMATFTIPRVAELGTKVTIRSAPAEHPIPIAPLDLTPILGHLTLGRPETSGLRPDLARLGRIAVQPAPDPQR